MNIEFQSSILNFNNQYWISIFNIEFQSSILIIDIEVHRATSMRNSNHYYLQYKIMTGSPNSSKFVKLIGPDFDLDCPNPQCNGWLIFFAKRGDEIPCFLRWANSSKNNGGTCSVNSIFANKDGTCPACSKRIQTVRLFYKNKIIIKIKPDLIIKIKPQIGNSYFCIWGIFCLVSLALCRSWSS